MGKRLSILLSILLMLSIWATADSQTTEIYIQRLQSDWASAFSEPFEILYLTMYDTSGFGLTTMEEGRINITVAWLEEHLADEGYKISDIAIMVHKHFRVPYFSWGNGLVLMKLRERGFGGSFGVYHVPSGKILWAKNG